MRTMKRLCLALLLAGCTIEPESTLDMSMGCQLAKCICAAEKVPFLEKRETAPVQWQEDGAAYCAEGFVLEPADE